MRGGVWLLLLFAAGVSAAVGVASARAGGLGTTTTGTGTVQTTTGTAAATTTPETTTPETTTEATTAETATTATSPAPPGQTPKPRHQREMRAHDKRTDSSRSGKHSSGPNHSRKHRRQPLRPPPDFPTSPYPFLSAGGLAPAAQDNAVVSVATRYLGVPYKWGGARPRTGFDCSGLVQYVFAKLGVSLPHYAAAQWYSPDAVWVPPNRLQPGDLVFFTGSDGTRKAPGHVGIYVGDGYLIDAPHRGSFVRIDNFDERWFANNYVGAKRIVGVSFHARHLTGVSSRGSDPPAPVIRPQLVGETLSGSPRLIAAVRTAVLPSSSHGRGLWTGVGSAGLLLLLGGAVTYTRRRPRAAP